MKIENVARYTSNNASRSIAFTRAPKKGKEEHNKGFLLCGIIKIKGIGFFPMPQSV